MHLPNEFLNNGTAAGLAGIAALAVGLVTQKVRSTFFEKIPILKARFATFPHNMGDGASMSIQHRLSKLGQEKIWRMAAIGSLIFSAQMVNFSIGGGISGHLLGGVLAALILGPFEAFLVMSVVLATQAFVFADGGVIALGANIFNIGIVGALGGYSYFIFLTKNSKQIKKIFLRSAFVAAWLSVVFSAVAASLEIAWSGTQSLPIVLPSMILTHISIGLGEGLITIVILFFLQKKNFSLEILKRKDSYAE
ncbi:MAG: energy-coupling factor ABC transporter permease [Candidatus Moranbacteria bacterium]|jgi:cobalt/nickel transport system permease protein|nr:energy-coupling factor ABC transporter permease [Candidatus Moranbacteria bacterium]MBP9801374.1 energy-coupling factor ABC transporter permease [Candidatus Moranbacteria bacterium]